MFYLSSNELYNQTIRSLEESTARNILEFYDKMKSKKKTLKTETKLDLTKFIFKMLLLNFG